MELLSFIAKENKMPTPPVTDTLARFVAESSLSNISEATRAQAKMHILDTLGVALVGVSTAAPQIVMEYCRRVGDSQEATLWGTRQRSSAPMAAFANGLFAHAIDYDDWEPFIHAGHPSSMVVGAGLPLAETTGASGQDLLKAYIVGIEVLTKIAGASPNLQSRGFHSTPVLGSIGAAAASASLLKLDTGGIKAAFGVAASGCGGIHRQQGSMVKPFHAGNSARNGIEAALLAEKGFTADPEIFEAPRGFCDTFFGTDTCDYQKMITDIGKPYFLEAPGMGLKKHPCSAPQFLAADAALHLRQKHDFQFADVSKIEVGIPPERYRRHYHAEVRTGLRGKFAVNYVVAMAVLDGKLEIATFVDEKVNEPRSQEALRKVHVVVDESIPEPGPYCPVTVELKNGMRFSHTATIAKGDPRNPMSEEEVLEKFRSNARTVISDKQCDALAALIKNMEEVENVKRITDLLVPNG
jgi:2-methylcitrate dehydratase PrpD